MYVPAHFREDRLPVLHEAIRATHLTTLVTFGSEGLEASHLPVLLDDAIGPFGTIRGHVSRANLQWNRTDGTIEALAIFLGPDAYVSPSWYPSKREHGKVVPTWNYLTVHGYGRIEFFQDGPRLHELVTKLTERHEGDRDRPWAVADAPADYIQAQLRGIVGFELTFTRLQGKWKMSQNRDAADRAGVAAGLEADGEAAVAQIMRDLS